MAMEDEELLLRQMPHSVEAEQAVLGSMLIDSRCVPEVIERLRGEDFYLRQNREIFETIYSMFNFSLTIDPVTVLDQMRQNGVYDENTSRNYILQLMDTTPTAANVGEYVDIVRDKSLLRRIVDTAGQMSAMVQEGTGTAQEVLEAAEQKIFSIRKGRRRPGAGAYLQHYFECISETGRAGGQRLRRARPVHGAGGCGCGHFRPEQF